MAILLYKKVRALTYWEPCAATRVACPLARACSPALKGVSKDKCWSHIMLTQKGTRDGFAEFLSKAPFKSTFQKFSHFLLLSLFFFFFFI